MNLSAIGGMALESCPRIEQVFILPNSPYADSADFERALYVLRRQIEKRVDAETSAGDTFYVCTLSSRTIVYKGLLNAPQLRAFYPDLSDLSFKSALAIVHQRYSTNTFPTWQLAQPFRYLAHNGEINTLRGNINQMRSRETHFESPLFGQNIKKVIPVIRENQSDSACLDNAVELYYSAGRSLAHTMLMLVPQAWGKNFYVSKDIQGFFEYNSGLSEPWDGPAALAFTDGVNVGALLDRNGLRPARYTLTRGGLFVLASETGVLEIPPSEVVKRGRLGAGEMIYIDMLKHRIVYDKDRHEKIGDGFFYTIGYGTMTSAELLSELLLCGVCAISLSSTGSRQHGIRVCVSQMNRPEQFELLDRRLEAFAENHPLK